MDVKERFSGCLLGLACGDAVGATVEFLPRGSFELVTDMVGGGPYNLKPGQWTDDTSLALCLATSLLEKNGHDAHDQLERYNMWRNAGYLSSTGDCFDIGTTTRRALQFFERSGNLEADPDPANSGNGSIMRLAPVPMFYLYDLTLVETYSALSSITTHASLECRDACRLFGRIIGRALLGQPKDEVLFGDAAFIEGTDHLKVSERERLLAVNKNPFVKARPKTTTLTGVAQGTYRTKTVDQIYGTGYVVQSLEAALWCFHTTDTFEAAILRAANLGDDADTTAAICGQVAGAFYGEGGIPPRWLERLTMAAEIRQLALQLQLRTCALKTS